AANTDRIANGRWHGPARGPGLVPVCRWWHPVAGPAASGSPVPGLRPADFDQRSATMTTTSPTIGNAADRDAQVRILTELNRHYVRAIDEADTAWFEEHLASDFMNMNPDGALLDRMQFITQVGRGSSVRQ